MDLQEIKAFSRPPDAVVSVLPNIPREDVKNIALSALAQYCHVVESFASQIFDIGPNSVVFHIDAAMAAAAELSPGDLKPILDMRRPPEAVMRTVECLMILLRQPYSDWMECRSVLASSTFLTSLKEYDVFTALTRQVVERLAAHLQGVVIREPTPGGTLLRFATAICNAGQRIFPA